jgi:ribosomal protein S18 acetylase RimI-like enzyme
MTPKFTLTSGGSIRVREKTTSDGPALGQMLESCSEQTYHFFHPYELTLESGEKVAANEEILCHVAFYQVDRAVGYVWLQGLDSDFPTLGICVVDGWQDQGIGHLLMNTAIEEGRSLSKDGIKLTVNQDNPRARSLYEKVGFKLEREVEGRFSSYSMILKF